MSRIVWIELDTFEIVMLTNDLLPGDISMEDFVLALASKGGWLQWSKQLLQCRYQWLLWSMYTCIFIEHMSSFNIALPVIHRRTSFFFGVKAWADSRDFCLISFFVLADMPKVPMCKKPEYSWNLIKHALLLKYWIILQTFWEDYPF